MSLRQRAQPASDTYQRGGRVFAFALAALFAIGGAGAQAAGPAAIDNDAEQSDREVLLGTAGGARNAVPAQHALPPAKQAAPAQVATAEPAEMLADALGRLGAGDRTAAARMFEQLVARHPDSREASHARRYLGEAYRSEAPRAATEAPAPQPAPAAQPATAQPDGARIGDGWHVSVHTETALEHRLISEVGDRVFFSAGSADLGSRARAVLVGQAAWLNRQPHLGATIEGHADESGSEADNTALSAARADAVRNRLVAEGVAPERLRVVARGRTERVAECSEPECGAQNRRVVIVPYSQQQEAPLSAAEPPSDVRIAPLAARRGEHGPALSAVSSEALPRR